MQHKTYFYIIDRSGQIFEIEFTDLKLAAALAAKKEKGLLALPNDGIFSLSGVDIMKVLSASQYENHLETARIKRYIKNGTWYDSKSHEVIRHEEWKQKIIDSYKTFPKLEDKPSNPASAEDFAKIRQSLIDKSVLPANYTPSK